MKSPVFARLLLAALLLTATQSFAQVTLWKKRVARTIDMSEKEDDKVHKLKNAGSDSVLVQHFLSGIMSGKLTAYSNYDAFFTTKLTINEIKEKVASRIDTIIIVDPVTGKEIQKLRQYDFRYDLVKQFRVLEDWTFNTLTGVTDIQVVGIAPVIDIYGDDGLYRGQQALFWLKYNEAHPYISRYELYHPDNTIAMHIWNDYFLSDVKPKVEK